MATEFGKILRKIRIDNDELLKDMAAKLDITSAYLSSIENGKRSIPENFVKIISELYNLPNETIRNLEIAEDSIKTTVSFNLSETTENQRKLVISLARQFEEISEEDLQAIRRIIEHKER